MTTNVEHTNAIANNDSDDSPEVNEKDQSNIKATTNVVTSSCDAQHTDIQDTPEESYTDYSRVTMERLNGTGPSAFYFAAATAREAPFPVKLHQILSNPDFQDIIAWLPHGRSWRVLKPKAFEDKVIPLHFRHSRFSSFMRQVNGWGFKRVFKGVDLNSYYHELFLRGLPHLCLKMRRPDKHQLKVQSKGQAPDFYALSQLNPLPAPLPNTQPEPEQDVHAENEAIGAFENLAAAVRQEVLQQNIPTSSVAQRPVMNDLQLALLLSAEQGQQSNINPLAMQQSQQAQQIQQIQQQLELGGLSGNSAGVPIGMNDIAQLRNALVESQLQSQRLATSLKTTVNSNETVAPNHNAASSDIMRQLEALGGLQGNMQGTLSQQQNFQGSFQNAIPTQQGLQGGFSSLGGFPNVGGFQSLNSSLQTFNTAPSPKVSSQQAQQQQLLLQLLQQQGI